MKRPETLKSFLKKQLKQHGGDVPPLEPIDPLRALVRGCLAANTTNHKAEEALAIIDREFVDLNELRVATELECIDIIGARYPGVEDRVPQMIHCLNGVFAREHTLSLERLRTIPRREARQFLKELPGITPFIDGYTTLYGFGIPAFPVDETILAALEDEGIVEPDAKTDPVQRMEQAQKFVEHHLKDDECHKLFWCMRHKKRK